MTNKYTYILMVFILCAKVFAQDDFFISSSRFGGYGELHYNYTKPENGKSTEILDFHRFVLFYAHNWTEKWSFKAEVEIEHNFVSSGEGELELEQAYVNYHYADYFGLKAGVILTSVGLINEFHEPPLFFGVERPDYHNKIIPTTWYGNGISLYGAAAGFSYTINIMEGLNADKFSASSGIRNGRLKGFKSNAENLLYNFSLNYVDIPGIKIGASFIYNDALSNVNNNAINLFEGHLSYKKNNVIFVGEFANISYESADVKSSQGFYVDLGYNVGSPLSIQTKIIPFVRYTNYNTASSVYNNNINPDEFQNSKFMFGVNVLPIDEIVFKFDYSMQTTGINDSKTNLFNAGIGYMF